MCVCLWWKASLATMLVAAVASLGGLVQTGPCRLISAGSHITKSNQTALRRAARGSTTHPNTRRSTTGTLLTAPSPSQVYSYLDTQPVNTENDCVCVCVCLWEWMSDCVCVSSRSINMCTPVGGWESVCVCVCVCV